MEQCSDNHENHWRNDTVERNWIKVSLGILRFKYAGTKCYTLSIKATVILKIITCYTYAVHDKFICNILLVPTDWTQFPQRLINLYLHSSPFLDNNKNTNDSINNKPHHWANVLFSERMVTPQRDQSFRKLELNVKQWFSDQRLCED